MRVSIKNIFLFFMSIVFLSNQGLDAQKIAAQKTKVTCENKTDVKVEVKLNRHKGQLLELDVKAKESKSKEWTSNEFLVGAYVRIEEAAERNVGTSLVKAMRKIGEAFYRKLEGKYSTGPRTVKITITNDKIITVITDSTGKNPETITTNIKPPLK